ncbi:MAG: prolyl aminopeptidase [Solirubrobacteraceae bacterium]
MTNPAVSDAFYPEVEPFATGRLQVCELHTLYYERCGNPDGRPAVFLHGGPGAGLEPEYRRYFDPEAYHVVLFDQRGAGRSTPHAELRENTTWDLVADMETLREEFAISSWVVVGGSWGSTLGLAYAETHPDRVDGLILRGVFMGRRREIQWLYQEGASRLFPDAWEGYLAPIPDDERDDLLAAYHRRLTSDDEAVRLEAAKAWSIWEASASKLHPDPDLVDQISQPHQALSLARLECHYLLNRCFLDYDTQLLDGVGAIRGMPGTIVNGRYDVICPPESAWTLHRAWPAAELDIVPDAGHSGLEPGIVAALVAATDRLR